MSVILEALKKLEREKAASRGGAVDVVPEILSSHRRRSASGKWPLVMVVLAAVCLTVVVTLFAVGHVVVGNRQNAQLATPVAKSEAIASQTSGTGRQADQINNDGAGESVREATGKNAFIKSAQAAPDVTNQSFRRQQEQQAQTLKVDKPAMVAGAASSPFTVSGIAWQEARADRRAVVNGALLGEGAMLEDARIVRIYQDRVRFSRGGQTFDVAIAGGSAQNK